MERFGLFEILKNMLPFLGDNAENGKETRDGADLAETAPPFKETDVAPQTSTPNHTPPSTSHDAILQFMSSHETRSKRIKK